MAPAGQGGLSDPGMPGAPGRSPGWRRRGCRRPPRMRRTARSRRPATRRPHPAGPVQSRHGRPPRPAPRTGAWRSADRGRCARAGTDRAVPQAGADQPGWPRTTPARPRRGEEHLAGESVVARVQGRKPAQHLEDVSVAGESVEQHTTGGHSVLSGRPLSAGHVTTVDQSLQRGRPFLRRVQHAWRLSPLNGLAVRALPGCRSRRAARGPGSGSGCGGRPGQEAPVRHARELP